MFASSSTTTNMVSLLLAVLLLLVADFDLDFGGGSAYVSGFGDTQVCQSQPQTPTAYTTGGGGFWTMTDSMGIIRAWHESNILEHNTTHFGGKF